MRRRRDNRITGRQEIYLRRLLNDAFAKRVALPVRWDSHHLDTMTREEASSAIDRVKAALASQS